MRVIRFSIRASVAIWTLQAGMAILKIANRLMPKDSGMGIHVDVTVYTPEHVGIVPGARLRDDLHPTDVRPTLH
jgi:hypothetical protein